MRWHGYPQHDDAHPERPWWIRHTHCGLWRRIDGVDITDDALSHEVCMGSKRDLLACHDREHPLPVPEPRCGQVWHWLTEKHDRMVLAVELPQVWFGGESPCFPGAWPPPDAVLVAGPGSPWAPPDYQPPHRGKE